MADSSNPNDILLHQLFELFINRMGNNMSMPDGFPEKCSEIQRLLKNDYTGIVNSVLEYMIKAGTVDFRFYTGNQTLNKTLESWKKTVNQDVAIDIQRGLTSFTSQYLRERWTSSFIAVQVLWEKKDGYEIPSKIWLADGSKLVVEGNSNKLGNYTYKLGKSELHSTSKKTVIIRKPFNAWYDKHPDPYLFKRGTVYNSILKREILKKQGDVMEAILPYMLAIKAGTDVLAKLNQLPDEPELNKLVDQVKQIKSDYNHRIKSKGMVGAFSYDVSFEHLIPDLTKFFNDVIIKPIDRNIFSSLGLIELQGFSSNREEAIMNPKVLVEEVKSAVVDLSLIYEDIMLEFLKRNKIKSNILVVPGTIKSFITDNMRLLARSAYDRGTISRKTFNEDFLELNFEVEVQQSDIERRRNIPQRMFPPVILNQDSNTESDTGDPEQIPNKSPDKKKTEKQRASLDFECPNPSCRTPLELDENIESAQKIECPNCNEQFFFADIENQVNNEYEESPYNTVNDLPKQVKVLPIAAQVLWLRTFNSVLKESGEEEKARKIAWFNVEKKYKKNADGKWVKK